MRPGQQNKRMRGRGRRGPSPLSRSYESNGPDVKIRGTASHIAEKYMQLARDAQTSGEMVSAENYFQHAEHYFRIIAAAQAQNQQQNPNESQRTGPRGADDTDDDGDDDDDTTPQQTREQGREQGRDQGRDQSQGRDQNRDQNRERNRDQNREPNRGQGPQPTYQPPVEQPIIEQPQPRISADGAGDQGKEPKPQDAVADQANGTQSPKRRRRRAVPAASGANGSDEGATPAPEQQKAETPKAEKPKAETAENGPDGDLLTAGDA
jgi:uncharacterized protein DUF4167